MLHFVAVLVISTVLSFLAYQMQHHDDMHLINQQLKECTISSSSLPQTTRFPD